MEINYENTKTYILIEMYSLFVIFYLILLLNLLTKTVYDEKYYFMLLFNQKIL
jgi:hypothetical protein